MSETKDNLAAFRKERPTWPGYKIVNQTESPATDIGTAPGAQRMGALFRKYPNVKYIFVLSESWAGTFAQTRDGLPYIGSTPQFPRGYFALGYGGNGITFSLVAARMMRDLFLGKENRDAEVFRFGR